MDNMRFSERLSGRLICPSGRESAGNVVIEEGIIRDIETATHDLECDLPVIVPGFVDLHCHGGFGSSFASHDESECRRAIAYHRRRGTTRQLASLVSATQRDLIKSCELLGRLTERNEIEGIHLEGPFLSDSYRGSHRADFLTCPDIRLLEMLQQVSHGALRMVTIAPELSGSLDVIAWCRDQDIVAAVGHTSATADQTAAAITAGASVATHLYNAMRPIHHRDPGPVPVLLTSDSVICELIIDGVHAARPAVELALASAGSGRLAAVSDAIPAAGKKDGQYTFASTTVRVSEGRATMTCTGRLAGSMISLADSFRLVRSWAWPWSDAVEVHSATPAQVLNLKIGVAVGRYADLLVVDAHSSEVRSVMRAGRWVA